MRVAWAGVAIIALPILCGVFPRVLRRIGGHPYRHEPAAFERWDAENSIPLLAAAQIPGAVITVTPGDDIQSVVDRNGPHTRFVLMAGVHRLQTISPKDGDTFEGQPGAILSGAMSVNSFASSAGTWTAYWASQEERQGIVGLPLGSEAPVNRAVQCKPAFPACNSPQDLYFDNAPLQRVHTPGALHAGTWYLEPDGSRIQIAENPAGHTVEIGLKTLAFRSRARDVSIQNLIIEKYANPAQIGAIYASGPNWILDHCEIRLNHGTGVKVGDNMKVLNSYIHHNGQLGLGSAGSADILIEHNEIAFNNYAGYAYAWEAGGTKFALANGLIVRDNYVHDNEGPGLWSDFDDVNALYENNKTARNRVAGILYEVSSKAIIRNNTIDQDGYRPEGSNLWYGAGILIANSSDVEVYGNIVQNCVNGIGAVFAKRGNLRHLVRGISVHGNIVTQSQGVAAGIVQDHGFDDSVFHSLNNCWFQNTYSGSLRFEWMNAVQTLEAWQGFGNDVPGPCAKACCTSTPTP